MSTLSPMPPATPAPADDQRRLDDAKAILRRVFSAFTTAREERKGLAWRGLQKDLGEYADVLIMSGQISLPQMIDTMQKLEEYMGSGEHEDSGEDASEVVKRWLNGEDSGEEFEGVEAGNGTS